MKKNKRKTVLPKCQSGATWRTSPGLLGAPPGLLGALVRGYLAHLRGYLAHLSGATWRITAMAIKQGSVGKSLVPILR